MIDVEAIRRPYNYDTDWLVRVLEPKENRFYYLLVLGSVTVVREYVDKSIEYVNALREVVGSERPDFASPYEAVLPI
jgi:hypothetical protein